MRIDIEIPINFYITKGQLKDSQALAGILNKDAAKPMFQRYLIKGTKTRGGRKLKASPGLGRFTGRFKTKKSNQTLGEVAKYLNKKYEWIEQAFKSENQKELDGVLDFLVAHLHKEPDAGRRYLNGLVAMIRNPITRKEFGSNKLSTIAAKGFDFPMKNVGVFTKNIRSMFFKG
jgi:hypothetical protein